MKKVKLEIVQPEDISSSLQPILGFIYFKRKLYLNQACFPQNIPNTELTKESVLNFLLYENLINSDQKMLVGESDLFNYVGKNFGEFSQKNAYQKLQKTINRLYV